MAARRRHGGFYVINLALAALYGFAVWPLLEPTFGFRALHLAWLALHLGPLAVWLWLAWLAGERGNRALLLTGLAAFATAEAALRWQVPAVGTVAEAGLARARRPYVMFAGEPGGAGIQPEAMAAASDAERPFLLNAEGYRIERALKTPKPADEFRVFLLGGSVAFNGAPLAQSIGGWIEAIAPNAADGRQVRVYNYGTVSAVSGQELALVAHHLAGLNPDLILTFDGGNDISLPYIYDPRPGYPFDFMAWEAAFAGQGGSPAQALAQLLRQSRVLARLLDRPLTELATALGPLRAAAGWKTPDWERRVREAYLGHLDRLCLLAKGGGWQFAAFLQPVVFAKEPLAPAEAALRTGSEDFADYMRRQYDDLGTALAARDQAARAGGEPCRFHDLGRLFDGDAKARFWDFIHIDNDGNRVAAEVMAKRLALPSATP